MKDESSRDEFASALLARDAWLASPEFLQHRRALIERVTRAAKRERHSRKLVLLACAAAGILLGLLYVTMAPEASVAMRWPDWVRLALALVFILIPVALLLLLGIYLFRYRLELNRAQRQARQQALLDLPAQITQLRHDVDELKAQLKQANGPPNRPASAGSAFTLMEVLVVVGVLGILAALLLPALARAKSSARTTACKNNLSQMGKALDMYEADFNCFPGAGQDVVLTRQPPWAMRSPDSWRAKLTPYLSGNTNIFVCPSFHLPPPYSAVTGVPAAFISSYGYNADGCCRPNDLSHHLGLGRGNGDYLSLTSVKAPADMIGMGDLQLPPGLARFVISPWHKLPVGALKSVIPPRHAGGANMVFVDSHVEWAKQARWIEAAPRSRARWNNDHQPHAEAW